MKATDLSLFDQAQDAFEPNGGGWEKFDQILGLTENGRRLMINFAIGRYEKRGGQSATDTYDLHDDDVLLAFAELRGAGYLTSFDNGLYTLKGHALLGFLTFLFVEPLEVNLKRRTRLSS